ncbi:hypothetical protein B0H13DRAFT_2667574 [Mycena leptocephala]|nr:hypothetical protein B0H13DRAFT_2667574 [Mycena leptocephala]
MSMPYHNPPIPFTVTFPLEPSLEMTCGLLGTDRQGTGSCRKQPRVFDEKAGGKGMGDSLDAPAQCALRVDDLVTPSSFAPPVVRIRVS